MKTLRALSACAVLAAVAAGCSDSVAPSDVTLAELVGTWNATRATFDEVAGDGSIDAIPDVLGVSFSITVGPSGSYTTTATFPGEDPDVEPGTLTVAAGVITLTPTDPLEDPQQLQIQSFSGDDLTVFYSDEEWDFTDDSVDNPTAATLTVVLRRQ